MFTAAICRTTRETSLSNLIDRFFKDKDGKWAIWQTPNLALITWAIAQILVMILPAGTVVNVLKAVPYGALFVWSWQEALQGNSYFRRTVGVIILFNLIRSRI